MALLILSFIAGALTVLAPCILPLLPVVVGGSIVKDQAKTWYRPWVIAGSLASSVILFTLLLKATTSLLGVPQLVWGIISGVIVILLGLNLLWPNLWQELMHRTGLYSRSQKLLGSNYQKQSIGGDILMGAALGPIFSSCSPTYALIVAVVLPQSFARGFVYLLAYAIGLALTLLLVGLLGQTIVKKLGWLSNPNGWFRRVIGLLFIIVGLMVILGLDKSLQTYVLERGWYDPISQLEESLRP